MTTYATSTGPTVLALTREELLHALRKRHPRISDEGSAIARPAARPRRHRRRPQPDRRDRCPADGSHAAPLERFAEQACPGLDPGWDRFFRRKIRYTKTPRARSVSSETERAPARCPFQLCPGLCADIRFLYSRSRRVPPGGARLAYDFTGLGGNPRSGPRPSDWSQHSRWRSATAPPGAACWWRWPSGCLAR